MGLTNGGLINVGSKRAQQDTLALSDGIACFTGSFSGVTSTSISHGLNSTDLVVEFKDSLGNLLIPDTWSITNLNVIEAEFTPAATGDVTILACIESGLSPITGGVLILEGLSGIIDLDCPDGSVDISTSGQVINICSIFTPASGALLEQKCEDIDTLSGLIGGGSGNPVDSRPATGVITPDADCVYDLGAELARWRALYACSGLFRDTVGIGTSEPDGGLHVSGLRSIFERNITNEGQSVVQINVDANGFGGIESLHINHETGATSGATAVILVDVNDTEAEGGAVAALGVVTASGANRTVGLAVGARVDPILQFIGSELSSSSMTVGLVDGVDELSDLQDPGINTTLFVDNGDDLVIGSDEQFGQIFVDLILGAGKNLRTVFEYSTGVGTFLPFNPLDGTDGFTIGGSIFWGDDSVPGFVPGAGGNFLIRMTRNRSGNIGNAPIASQVSIALNTIEQIDSYFWDRDGSVRIQELGVHTTTLPNDRNAIETSGNIQTSGHINPFGDCVYDLGTTEDRWANLNACSGTFSERPTVNGSGVLLEGEVVAGGATASGQAFYRYDGASGLYLFSTDFSPLPLNDAIVEDSPFYTVVSGQRALRIETDGLYEIEYNHNMRKVTSNTASKLEGRVVLNGDTIVSGTTSVGLLRNRNSENTDALNKEFKVGLTAGDILMFEAARVTGNGLLTFMAESTVSASFIRS